MPHKETCTDRGELGIDDDGNDFCINCGEVIKPNEDSVILQAKFLRKKRKMKKKRKTFDEIFNEWIKPILSKYWENRRVIIELPDKSGYFYIFLKFDYLNFDYLKKFEIDIGKHGWSLYSIISQSNGFALRCKT